MRRPPERLHAKLFTWEVPAWSTVEQIADEILDDHGPLAPFIVPGVRDRVSFTWFTTSNRPIQIRSVGRRNAIMRRASRDPMNSSLPHAWFAVWGDGDPFRDERPDMVSVSFQFNGTEPAMKVDVACPIEEHDVLIESLAWWIERWGCRVGSGWVCNQLGTVHPVIPKWGYASQILQSGLLDPDVLGATWLMALRPGVWSSIAIPEGLEHEPIVTEVNTAQGPVSLVRLAPQPIDLSERDRWAWDRTLRERIPAEFFDEATMAKLLHQRAMLRSSDRTRGK